ncbi:hypothetical protein EJB05_18000, partial [Eragrostis curvula]
MQVRSKLKAPRWLHEGRETRRGRATAPVSQRSPGGRRSRLVGTNETFEKAASFGVAPNLTMYLVKRFNIGQLKAADITNIFYATLNFTPSLIPIWEAVVRNHNPQMTGMLGLTLSASLPVLKPPTCNQVSQLDGHCSNPSTLQLSVLYLSLGLLTIGGGAVRPCSLPFGVDQFDTADEENRKSLNSYYNWYYGTSTAALVFSTTILIYIQNNFSWAIGFGIPTVFMFLAIIFYFAGTRLYVHVPPEGSIFSGIEQVLVASFKKRRLKLPCPHDVNQQELMLYSPPTRGNRIFRLPLTSQFRNSWELSSIQQIEEVKCLIRIVPICFSGILCFVAMAQQFTFIILQAFTMDCHLGPHFKIPAGTVTLLQRQGVGLVLASISMVVAGLVERKRRNSALSNGGISPITFLWLAPQLVLMGIAEAFNTVGQIEFYNKQFPEHMQTLAGSLLFCTVAGANYLSTALANITRKATDRHGHTSWLSDNINNGKLDYYYYLIAILGVFNLFYFLICSHYYQYKAMSPHAGESIKTDATDDRATESTY